MEFIDPFIFFGLSMCCGGGNAMDALNQVHAFAAWR
jgi:hypothetical protein